MFYIDGTCSGIVVGKGVDTTESNPTGCSGRQQTDTPSDGSSVQRTSGAVGTNASAVSRGSCDQVLFDQPS